ncbi:MAG: hypothetical protein RL385_4407 [Pseudomonadota bacterium]
MELHLNYETVAPFALQREITGDNPKPKAKLKADKINAQLTVPALRFTATNVDRFNF